ncbi:MAG: endonuclease [Bdellovibrionaceae bacterium]|nr:endonuclease [Pseudobdellovibrionaceae bacterium]
MKAGVTNVNLSSRLKVILKAYHSRQKNALDTIEANCKGDCYVHTPIGYKNARLFLLANFYLLKTPNGYGVHDVYCDHDIGPEDFPRGSGAGPNVLPDNRVINVEHTWPQSRFTGRYDTETQKSDLHHLFPTNSKTNSIRGNNKFGEVARDMQKLACPNVRSGVAAGGNSEIFEPPQEHKGNVARALFYFSTRYDLPIDPNEEAFLRKWNEEDPVDEEEARRNEEIFKVQFDRNPFIDYPDLADKISNF